MQNKKYATINYLLDEKGRKDCILKGGDGTILQSLNVEVNETIIMLAEVSEDGKIVVNIGFNKNSYYNGKNHFEKIITDYEEYKYSGETKRIESICKIINFDKVMNSQELLEFEEKRIKELKGKEERLIREFEEYNKSTEQERIEGKRIREEQEKLQHEEYIKHQKEKEEKLRKEMEEKEEKEEKKEKEIQKWMEERDVWIKEHGSNYLKDAIELGYNIDKSYIQEKINRELSEFEIDFEDHLNFEKVDEPSEEAIHEAKGYIEAGYEAKIVIITCTTDGRDCEEEGIVIPNYLDRYYLARIL